MTPKHRARLGCCASCRRYPGVSYARANLPLGMGLQSERIDSKPHYFTRIICMSPVFHGIRALGSHLRCSGQSAGGIVGQAEECDTVSAFDFDVIRRAFKTWVREENVPEHRWRDGAAQMVRSMTGQDEFDPEMLEWIVRK